MRFNWTDPFAGDFIPGWLAMAIFIVLIVGTATGRL